MKKDLKDILSNLNTEVDQTTLLHYLQGHLTPQEQHDVEKSIIDDEFDTDALEGLEKIKDSQQLSFMVEQLNRDLKKKTGKRKQAREKLQIKSDPVLWVAVLVILLLVIVSYLLIQRNLQ